MARKRGPIEFRPKLVSLAVASCFAASTALANPTAPTVVNGQVSVIQNGNLLQITNSPSSIINWQSFSIGANEITRFIQQSQASAVLNRVTGAAGAIDPSVILGALQSNGRVFLVNPSGIVFGAGAQVDVAGLVATSLNLSNADFLAGRLKFGEMPGAGAIVNQGNLTARPGGEVYLVGPAVTNSGIITSPNGDVVLAAGNSVELVNPGTPNLRVEITAPDNAARNLGQIVVDSGRAGIYAGLINNSGTIRASSAVAEGGKILLKATRSVTLESTSILDASGAGGGRIEVLAKDGGTVNVAGTLDASAPVSGDGGFIETSADRVKVASGTTVSTHAASGKSGMWLIDPTTFIIGTDITGAALSANLNTTPVTITSDQGSPGASNDIRVDDAVSWNSPYSLTLLARKHLFVNQPVTNAGAGAILFYASWDGASTSAPTLSLANLGGITQNAAISTLGDVELIGAGNLVVGGTVTAGGYAILRATAGSINDGNGVTVNVVARHLEAAAKNGINLDTYITGGGPSYVNATNSASGNIALRNTSSDAVIQNIHNAGGNNVLSGLQTDGESTIITGGTVIHGDWGSGSAGQSYTDPANPVYIFTTSGGIVRIILNAPRANTYYTDTYLYLLDSVGNLIAYDDDSAQGYIAMLNQDLVAGTYKVVAATYSFGLRAPFDLSIGGAVTATAPTSALPGESTPPAVDQAFNQVVAATNQQTTGVPLGSSTRSSESGTGAGAARDEKKKQLPACGK